MRLSCGYLSVPEGFGAAQWFRLRGCGVSAAGPLVIAGPLVAGRMGFWGVGIGLGVGPQWLTRYLGLALAFM